MDIAKLNLSTAIKQALRCRTGNDFQAIAQSILSLHIEGFKPVLPYGSDGDGGNDGYSRSLGVYAQIYAPNSVTTSIKNAASKAKRDFAKLTKNWSSISSIKRYMFVANTDATNIHLERELSQISQTHGIAAEFFGTDELTAAVLKMPRDKIEELMGFKIARQGDLSSSEIPETLAAFSKIDPRYLEAVHLLTALAYPVVESLCEGVLPGTANWKDFFQWLSNQGWSENHDGQILLKPEVSEACEKNVAAQTRACELWIPALLKHGSVDCLYLAIRPLVSLGRLKDAMNTLSKAASELSDSGWNAALLKLVEIFDGKKLPQRLASSDRLRFLLGHANLLSSVKRYAEAAKCFKRAFRSKAKWPNGVNRALMLLNFGVAAHNVGEAQLATSLYSDAVNHARQMKDDWALGKAATNLAQTILPTDISRATQFAEEGKTAKKRAGDKEGLAVSAMVQGLIEAEQERPRAASVCFNRAKQLTLKLKINMLSDVCFNLARSYADAGNWAKSVPEYLQSRYDAARSGDEAKSLRAMGGLAESYFRLQDWESCLKVCTVLSNLADDTSHSDLRLTGLHGCIALSQREALPTDYSQIVNRALHYSRAVNAQHWTARILLDSTLGNPHRDKDEGLLNSLISEANLELESGNDNSAREILKALWQFCLARPRHFEAVEQSAKDLLDCAAKKLAPHEFIELSQWEYSHLVHAGRSLEALNCLGKAASVAKRAKLWSEYASSVDQYATNLAELGEVGVAVSLHREALSVAKKTNDEKQARISSANLAECLRRLGRKQAAYRASEHALALQSQSEDPEGFISALHNHHLVERAVGNKSAASQTLRHCEHLATKYGFPEEALRVKFARAFIALDDGQSRVAEKRLRAAVASAEKLKLYSAARDGRYNLAIILQKRGSPREAIAILNRSFKVQRNELLSLHWHTLTASLFEDVSELENAKVEWSKAAAAASSIDDFDQQAYCLTRQAFLDEKIAPQAARQALATKANKLLQSIVSAPQNSNIIQARLDKTQAFCTTHKLRIYEIRILQTVAERLSAIKRSGSFEAATEASIASVLLSLTYEKTTAFAFAAHLRWLLTLDVTSKKMMTLKKVAEAWIRRTLEKPLPRETMDLLLQGFGESKFDGLVPDYLC